MQNSPESLKVTCANHKIAPYRERNGRPSASAQEDSTATRWIIDREQDRIDMLSKEAHIALPGSFISQVDQWPCIV